MTYKVVVIDEVVDKSVTLIIGGVDNVFDAVSIASERLRRPINAKLIEAVPVTNEEADAIRKEMEYDYDVLW